MYDCPKKGHNICDTGRNNLEVNLLLHTREDHAGVAITDIKAGEKIYGLFMDDHTAIELNAAEDIPLGHKLAVRPVLAGEHIVLYGRSAGQATQSIQAGDHVHIHNMKSLRWV